MAGHEKQEQGHLHCQFYILCKRSHAKHENKTGKFLTLEKLAKNISTRKKFNVSPRIYLLLEPPFCTIFWPAANPAVVSGVLSVGVRREYNTTALEFSRVIPIFCCHAVAAKYGNDAENSQGLEYDISTLTHTLSH